MAFGRGLMSPGPSWTVLPQPTSSSSPSTRTGFESDIDTDEDMGDDEAEHDPTRQPPISKRKADSPTATTRRPQKLPRLEVNGATTTPSSYAGPSRTQPGPPPLALRKSAASLTQVSRVESADSGASTSDFPTTITERVQRMITREKGQGKGKEKEKEGGRAKEPPVTARKRTTQPKHVQRVSTASLLKHAQTSTRGVDPSLAWTRVRPRLKPQRTNFDAEMARARPLALARQRDGDTIELTDSSDSMRLRRPFANGVRLPTLVNKDDPIVITSGSEDEQVWTRPTQRRTGPAQTRAPRPPLPSDVEVISITDSEEDVGRSSRVLPGPTRAPVRASASAPLPASTSVPTPASTSVLAPAPAPAPASTTSTLVPEAAPTSTSIQVPETSLPQNTRPPSQSSSPPPFGPSPDDLDDPFSGMDFDIGGDDTNQGDDWDGVGVGTSSVTIPVTVSSGHPDTVGASVSGGAEDASDAFFDSYLNMEQLEGDMGPVANGGGDGNGDEEGEEEGELVGDPGSTRKAEGPPLESPDPGGDVCMQTLEEGEVDPNDAPITSMRRTDTQESGEIRSQESDTGGNAQTVSERSPSADVRMQRLEDGQILSARTLGTLESREIQSHALARAEAGVENVPSSTAPPSISMASVTTPALTSTAVSTHQNSSKTASTSSSASPGLPASQPPNRTGALVMPDLSQYKGVRFKRPLPDARENAFFSRALTGAIRFYKPPGNVGEKNASGGVSTSADAPLNAGEVQHQVKDAVVQDDTVAATRERVSISLLSPPPPPPPPTRMTTLDTQSTMQVRQSPIVEMRTSVGNAPVSTQAVSSSGLATPSVPPPATQPAPSSVPATPYAPPPATQPAPSSVPVTSYGPPTATQPAPSSVPATPYMPPSASQPAPLSSRLSIAPLRVPRSSTPMSLVEVLNGIRQQTLLKDRQQALKRRDSKECATPEKSLSRGPASPLLSTPTPPPSSQPTRALGKTPSLKDIRALLARRKVESLSARSSGNAPSEDGEHPSRTTAAPPVTPISAPVELLGPTENRVRMGSPEQVTRLESSELDTTTTASSGIVGKNRRRSAPFLPFEAFISPARPWDKDGERLPRTPRSRVSLGMPASQRPKGKETVRRRESAAAAFEAYIVRDSPRKRDVSEGVGTDRDENADEVGVGNADEVLVVESGPRLSGKEEIEQVAVDLVEDSGMLDDEDGGVDDAVEDDVDAAIDATHTNEGKGEGEDKDGTDETNALLELVSVHLSQTNLDAEAEPEAVVEVNKPEVDMLDEVETAGNESSPETSDAMVVDGPFDDGEAVPQMGAIDVTSESLPQATTPFLVVSKDPKDLFAADEHADFSAHERYRSGGADSVDECDALLSVASESETEASSKTVSSTSLAPPAVRSSGSHSRQTSPPVNPCDPVCHPTPVPKEEYECQYRVVTFASHVAEQRERPPEYKLAKDIPHSLQDHINALPQIRDSDIGRKIFEAHIVEAMVNEPDAPRIEIFDNQIGNEWTPRWEFHYTNELWYAEGVPPPDRKGLQSCGCVGRCDPKSGKCACAKRQLSWVQGYIDDEIIPPTWSGSPFVYDHRGLLQRPECPIFECNQFCACDEDCPNRVAQNGRKWPVHIARTMDKGWGVIAGDKKIPKGSFLGIYAGELLTEQEAEARGRYYDLYGRTYLFSVDFHHLKMDMEDPDEWENLYVVDACHAGNFTRFLNHSCDPNCGIFACYIDDADINKPLLAVFTTRDVEPWEELCFSYHGDIEEKREEIIERGGLMDIREHAVYIQCRCGTENCIGRLFS